MSKTLELRKVIQSNLSSVAERVYFEIAPAKATFPYIVYDLSSTNYGNSPRDDVMLIIDIWDKSSDTSVIERLTDTIETLLNNLNNPTPTVLPTFYLENRQSIQDEDKSIKRRQLRFEVQNYYKGGETIQYISQTEKFYVLK